MDTLNTSWKSLYRRIHNMEKTWQWLCAPPEQAPQPCYTIYPSSIGSVFVYIGKRNGGQGFCFLAKWAWKYQHEWRMEKVRSRSSASWWGRRIGKRWGKGKNKKRTVPKLSHSVIISNLFNNYHHAFFLDKKIGHFSLVQRSFYFGLSLNHSFQSGEPHHKDSKISVTQIYL